MRQSAESPERPCHRSKPRTGIQSEAVKQKTKVVTLWYETKSYVDTRRRFCREYALRTRDGPTHCTIQRLVKHFEHKGAVHNQSKGNSGSPASLTKSQANIDAMQDSAVDSPKKSHRWRSWELGINPTYPHEETEAFPIHHLYEA